MRLGVLKQAAAAILIIAFSGITPLVFAATLEDLQQEIGAKNKELQKLEEEAKRYRGEIAEHQERGKTLKTELNRINQTVGKLKRDITITEQTLKKTGLEIEALALEIRQKELAMRKLRSGLAQLLQALVEKEQYSLLENIFRNKLLSDFFRQVDYIETLEKRIISSLDSVKEVKKTFEADREELEKKKGEKEDTRRLLLGRNAVLTNEKRERDLLLRLTKNQEKKYQELLSEQEQRIAALGSEIREIEDQIRITIDTASLPPKSSGVLGWPLPTVTLRTCRNLTELINCITQYFGYTSFAAVGGYGGKGHNGTDFRAPLGTPVLAAEKGVIEAVGDTDVGCRGASYGKWILMRYSNNLSALYAHLSSIEVKQGQEIQRGERIGLSGKTGYATGPHLHFSVFASQAVQVKSIRSKVCGRLMTLPIAAINGYLNPLDYL